MFMLLVTSSLAKIEQTAIYTVTKVSESSLKLPSKPVTVELDQSGKKLSISGLCNKIEGQLLQGTILRIRTRLQCDGLMELEEFVIGVVQRNLGILQSLSQESKKLYNGKYWIIVEKKAKKLATQ